MVDAEFHPYADDAATVAAAGLTFENGTDAVSVYGNATFTRDARGLADLRRVLEILKRAETVLGSQDLPETVAAAEPPGTVANPFG